MNSAIAENPATGKKPLMLIFTVLGILGIAYFAFLAAGSHPEKAWLVYLVNFLLFTLISLGGLLFSTLMHFTKAKWCRSMSGVAESFSAFFPVSFILFIGLLLGKDYLFTWVGEDLHGKEIWLNVPFLFTRDLIGFFILYALGFGYLYHSLRFRLNRSNADSFLKRLLNNLWGEDPGDMDKIRRRMTYFAGWYMFAFTMVLSLVGFDLVMSMDAHWYSTLFGAYTFVKATFSGFGALIIVTAILHLSSSRSFEQTSKQFRDLATLFFGFSIVWGDFFYAQFLVIWYGNIPEETTYIIERTMTQPWNYIAWAVFIICFIMPFLILLNRKVKETPQLMIVVCSLVIIGFWMEHFLLLAPVYLHHVESFPIGINDVIISLGFLSLFAVSIITYFKQFPELLDSETGEVV
ncbi:MAG: hypothetical protein MJE63_00115 [Proteobacteria bacterium]|nr:hypothetical protein [Pseudomonadota bacterium]